MVWMFVHFEFNMHSFTLCISKPWHIEAKIREQKSVFE